MEKRRFGRTGIDVGVLGFGAAEIGYEQASPVTVDRMLGIAVDAGVNVIDTAECYGASEALLGQSMGHRRSSFYLFTKCGHSSGFDLPDWHPELLRRSIDRSLERLQTDYVDVINLHSPPLDILQRGEAIGVLEEARAAGKTRWIGCSNDGDAARYAIECGAFDVLETTVNIADQEAISLTLPLAHTASIGVIAKRPIANAAFCFSARADVGPYSQVYWDRLRELDYDFLKSGETQDHVLQALGYTLAQPGLHVAIVGTKSADRWRQNATTAASMSPLPAAEIRAIRDRWTAIASASWIGQR